MLCRNGVVLLCCQYAIEPHRRIPILFLFQIPQRFDRQSEFADGGEHINTDTVKCGTSLFGISARQVRLPGAFAAQCAIRHGNRKNVPVQKCRLFDHVGCPLGDALITSVNDQNRCVFSQQNLKLPRLEKTFSRWTGASLAPIRTAEHALQKRSSIKDDVVRGNSNHILCAFRQGEGYVFFMGTLRHYCFVLSKYRTFGKPSKCLSVVHRTALYCNAVA